ncbi:MAG: hypothetical protein M3Q12_01190 [Pseudomonadota bacterium]|nr:hypothetical protein [Pseudomonadota bacterium]
MKWNCGKTRQERAKEEYAKKQEWHLKFAWLPIRVGPEDCRWLEYVQRRVVVGPPEFVDFWGLPIEVCPEAEQFAPNAIRLLNFSGKGKK